MKLHDTFVVLFFFFDGRSFVFRRFRFKEKFEDTKRVNQVFRQKGFRSSYSNTLTVKQIQWGKFSGREQVPVVQFSYCYMYINWLIHTTGITSGVGTPETFLTEHLIHSFGIFKLFFESESSKNKTTTIKKKKKYYERLCLTAIFVYFRCQIS
jgi:hypothetical protein